MYACTIYSIGPKIGENFQFYIPLQRYRDFGVESSVPVTVGRTETYLFQTP